MHYSEKLKYEVFMSPHFMYCPGKHDYVTTIESGLFLDVAAMLEKLKITPASYPSLPTVTPPDERADENSRMDGDSLLTLLG